MERKIVRIVGHRIEGEEEEFLVQWKNSWIRASNLKNCSSLLRRFTVKRRKMLQNKEYEVEDILDRRFTDAGVEEFLVKWKNYDESSNTWEPRRNLVNAGMLLRSFMERWNIVPLQLYSIMNRRIVEGEIYYYIEYKERLDSITLTSTWVNKADLYNITRLINDYETELERAIARAARGNCDSSTSSSSDESESEESASE